MNRWRTLYRWMRAGGVRARLLTFLALVAVVVALLPMIVAKTPLLNVLLAAALPDDVLRVTARGASLSWISSPSLSGVDMHDAEGNLLLAAERVALDRALLNLVVNRHDLGIVEVLRPAVHLTVRADGSNLEDVVQKLLSHYMPDEAEYADEAAKASVAFTLRVIEGTVHIEDTVAGRRWRVDGLNVQYDSRAVGGFGSASLTGQVLEDRAGAPVPSAGRFAVSLAPVDGGREQLTLQADALPLEIIEPWLRRFIADSELRGTLSGRGTADWTITPAAFPTDITTAGTLAIDLLDWTAPALLGDHVRLARVELPWRLTSQPSGLAIEDLQVRSEILHVAMRGRLDPTLDAARHDVELRGVVDVARLAAMLPRALRIRDDTTITSGTIELAGRCQPADGGQVVTGSLRTGPLAATSAGRAFRWDEPVSASFAARRQADSIQLDSLRCDSQFLQVDASGNPQNFAANASFDLNRLAEQLGQFVDLSGVQLAGTGTASLNWQQAAADQFTTTATAELAQLTVSFGHGAWSEPRLAIRAQASGALDPLTHQPRRVETAELQVNGQGDELDARLTMAVDLAASPPVWPMAVRASGSARRWLTRVRPWLALDPWQIDGQSELSTTLHVADNAVEATDTRLLVTDLRATAPEWNIHESRLELSGDARWDATTSELASSTMQLVTSTVSLASKDVRYRAGDEGIGQLAGAAAFRADLARLAAWRATADSQPDYRASGELAGNVRFIQQADRITGELTANGKTLSLATRTPSPPTPDTRHPTPKYETIWHEPTLTLRGTAAYDSTADRLAFDQLQIQSTTLHAVADGQVQNLTTAADVNLAGTLNYDLAQITPLLRPYLGDGIRLTGREQARFTLAGQMNPPAAVAVQPVSLSGQSATRNPQSAIHWSRRVRAQLELPWGGAYVYGLPIGAGRLAANLGDGALRIDPLTIPVGEGQLTATPHVRFYPEPAELSLPAGPLLTNVRISQEISETMLKYVAPVLAGATQSEGQFSMQLDGTRVPLAEPKRADTAGRLTVHSVRVVPGPLAREFIGVAQQIEALARRRDPALLAGRPPVTLLSIRDQQVNFRVAEGRVHHQDMEFQIGEVTLRSQGSVGLDETLALTLQVPIQDAWIAREPLLAGLKGQSLQVPVTGTLTRPQLDQRAIANLSGQLLQKAAGQAIGDEVNKALDKIFKPR